MKSLFSMPTVGSHHGGGGYGGGYGGGHGGHGRSRRHGRSRGHGSYTTDW